MTAGAPQTGVSFVIPVFNKRRFLKQVIAGLAAQRGEFAREFIFIDDGSSDGSREELEQRAGALGDARILSQANAGPSVTTNRGLRAARYPLVKLVDGDDVVLPEATAQLAVALARHPEAALAYGQSSYYAAAEDALARIAQDAAGAPPPERIEDALKGLLRECYLGPSNCLIRRDAALAVGGCDERVFVQDYSLLLRLAATTPFVALDAPVVLHPSTPQDRLNDGGPQLLHDTNLTVAHFLAEHAMPAPLATMATRRAMTRAWLWAKRREGKGPLSRWYWLRLAAYLPLPGLRPRLLDASCGAFTLSRPVRHSVPAGP
ncbi:MAG TPA: glycosyltransferase [Stellaceae bacterium]|jgi:glycosyltransferase involved in cell wall biosynthesis